MNSNSEQYFVSDEFKLGQCAQAARLHYEYLSYRSFITNFGPEFLIEIYKDLLNQKLGFLVCYEVEQKIRGFALACLDTNLLFQRIKKKRIKYSLMILKSLIKRPLLIGKILETLRYTIKEDCQTKAELMVIAIDKDFRSKGVGSELIRRMETTFKKMRITDYKVTVHEAMERSNSFYKMNGFTLQRKFTMYNVIWNLYTKMVEP